MKPLAVVAVIVFGTVAVLSAQLGDVARKEAERRKTVKGAGKTYTNDNIKPDPGPSSVPASTGTQGAADAAQPAAPPPASPSATPSATPSASTSTPPQVSTDPAARKKEEAQWRERIKGAREALERAKAFAEALQSRINALNTDFVNRDDPAQRKIVAADRDKALAEMERLKKEIEQHNKAIATIQEEARRANAPPAWVR